MVVKQLLILRVQDDILYAFLIYILYIFLISLVGVSLCNYSKQQIVILVLYKQ